MVSQDIQLLIQIPAKSILLRYRALNKITGWGYDENPNHYFVVYYDRIRRFFNQLPGGKKDEISITKFRASNRYRQKIYM